MLHTKLVVLLGRWVGVDVDLAEGAKERGPEDAIGKRLSAALTFEAEQVVLPYNSIQSHAKNVSLGMKKHKP